MTEKTDLADSLVFDQAASYYDQTRALPTDISATLTAALIEHGRLSDADLTLEIGVGTGRIALPLLESKVPLIGIDMSLPMMTVMRQKRSDVKIAMGNAITLPFAGNTFERVIIVHVLHLIAGWQQALFETQRVLHEDGILLHSWTDRDANGAGARVASKFFESVQARGEADRRPGVRERSELTDFWRDQGWSLEVFEIAGWQTVEPLSRQIERISTRQWSATWQIPDPVFQEALTDLHAWVEENYGDPGQPQTQQQRLMLDVVSFS